MDNAQDESVREEVEDFHAVSEFLDGVTERTVHGIDRTILNEQDAEDATVFNTGRDLPM